MKNIILGTDWWSDCDDAVALRVLTRFHKEGRINLLGVAINACMKYSVASLRGFLLADGLDSIPIGIDLGAVDFEGKTVYQKRLAHDYCPGVKNTDAEDAVRLYRRLLAKAEEPVEIIEIGFLQVATALLQSLPDDISPLHGVELVKKKVSKIWVMGGKWDKNGEKEHNFCLNAVARRAAASFCALAPVPVTFLGFEVGLGVITGGGLNASDHLYRVMSDWGAVDGRHSWDPMLVLLALIGDEEEAGYATERGTASVDAESGANFFERDSLGNHRFVVKKRENTYYEDMINSLL